MPKGPDVGDAAPDFTLPSSEGQISLSEHLTRGPVLLVFYPGDDTTVCTRQLCNYRDNLAVFADLGVQVLGINPQSLESHEAFAKKYKLPFPLLSDEGGSVCRQYAALNFLGMAKRALVLVDRDGRVLWRRTDLPVFHQSASALDKVLHQVEL